MFTLIFAAGLAAIWFAICIPIRLKAGKTNRIVMKKYPGDAEVGSFRVFRAN